MQDSTKNIQNNLIFLAQSDTTIGFLSKNQDSINAIKCASNKKKLIKEYAYFRDLPCKIPLKFRRFVRYAKKTTFILPNKSSFRVIKEPLHRIFLANFTWLYSSSANRTTQGFEASFAMQNADIIVLDSRGLRVQKSSKILKINHLKMRKIR